MDTRVRLAVIPSMDKALRNLGIFAVVALHLFSSGGRYSSAITDLLRLIDRMEDLHTKVSR